MNRNSLFAGALLALGVVACSDERASEPTAPSLIASATCKYADVKKHARDLFGPNSDGYRLAQEMSGFPKDSPGATSKAFEIFAAIAAKRDATADFSAFISDAANLTVETIKCANVVPTTNIGLDVFTKALGPEGGYGVPAGTVTSIFAKDLQASVNAPNAGFASWLGNQPGLFYGFIPEGATAPSESQAGIQGRTVYDWSLLRPASAPGLSGMGSVSLCVRFDDGEAPSTGPAVNGNQLRLQKTSNILKFEINSLPCDPDLLLASAAPVQGGFFARILRGAGDWLAPEALQAAVKTSTSSPTGGAANFSLFYAVDPGSVNLSFEVQPVDGTLSGGIPGENGGFVTVRAVGGNGTDWEHVDIEVFGVNNNGAFAQFTNNVETTNADGLAVFDLLGATQTGAYTVLARTIPSNDQDVSAFVADTVEAAAKINVRP